MLTKIKNTHSTREDSPPKAKGGIMDQVSDHYAKSRNLSMPDGFL